MSTSVDLQFRYSFEEFMDHVRAMKTVRNWQYTQRFGHVGAAQDSRSNNARVLEYFSDSCVDQREAVHKAELFLSIYDYLGRNAAFFARKGLLDRLDRGLLSVEPALLRAVHFVFTSSVDPSGTAPRKLVNLARSFQDLEAN